MKLAIHSDLHLEGNRLPAGFGTSEEIDVVILAGDIGVKDLKQNLSDIVAAYPNAKQFLYVPGNHEYYGYDFYPRHEEMRLLCNEFKIQMLSPGSGYMTDGYYFIGSTCWSDMSSINGHPDPLDKEIVQRGVNDFHLIRNGDGKFTVDDMIARSKEEKSRIEGLLMVSKESGLKRVVISHFPPLLELRNPFFSLNSLTAYFHNDWTDLFVKYEPYAWIYGHIHYNGPVKEMYGTMLLTNQRGYNKEKSNQSYNPNYIIEI